MTSFEKKKGVKASVFFVNQFGQYRIDPPDIFRGQRLYDLWKMFSEVEQHFIHNLERPYDAWMSLTIQAFNKKTLKSTHLSQLQKYVVNDSPTFDKFLIHLIDLYSLKEAALAEIDSVFDRYMDNDPLSIFESACLFLMLANAVNPEGDDYFYFNVLMKAHEMRGEFNGWYQTVVKLAEKESRQKKSAIGGKNAAKGNDVIKNELLRLLNEVEENCQVFTSKISLSKAVAPKLFEFIEHNKSSIARKNHAGSAEELSERINDWSKRREGANKEIYNKFNSIVKNK